MKFGLRNKVLFPVAVMILAVIFLALMVVNNVVRRQVLGSVSDDLKKSRRVFEELEAKERELLFERAWVTAEAPHLKAAVDTRDSTTIQQVADELFKTLRSDILVISDQNNQVLAQHSSVNNQLQAFNIDSLEVHPNLDERQLGLLRINNHVYRVVVVPILALDEISTVYVLGKVILGNLIDQAYIRDLKALVDCEVIFTHSDMSRIATVTPDLTQSLFKSDTTLFKNAKKYKNFYNLEVAEEEYLIEKVGSRGNFLLLQSVDQAFEAIMQPIEKTMIFVAGFAFLATILISTFISHEFVSPIKKLAKATTEIMMGDYEHPIEIRSKDEIGQLAQEFDAMRQSLRQKITQLGQQNVELEEALKKLEATQEELVRSEKLAATGKITAQLSHELNNPIHNIQSCLETAQKKISKNGDAKEFIDLAYDEVLRIGDLVRQMLDFYRPAANGKHPVQVNKILKEVIKSSEHLFEENDIKIKLDLDPDLSEIKATGDQLKQVFLNLILNAVDAMPAGGKLQITTRTNERNVSIIFEDTGSGIEAQYLNKIFDAFFTTKEKASGVGLGLSVSYGIIRSHGGKILVQNKISKGAKFTVQLPA